MHLIEDQSLASFNTFGIDAIARKFVRVTSAAELRKALAIARVMEMPVKILGGGSNVLLTGNVEALVIHNSIMERTIVEQTDDYCIVAGGGGEPWHPFVEWCLLRNLGGIENLSLIPGTLGAAPIQNIGAYGVELKDVFEKLEAIEIATGQLHTFTSIDCAFGYRRSIFKTTWKDRFCITKVYLKLTHRQHQLSLEYGAIRDTLQQMEITRPGIREISEAVIRIRRSKLPDPGILGNAGSFFKNPELTPVEFAELQYRFPNIVHFPGEGDKVKVPAGWLIEQCGWKGTRMGQAGCYDKQALVLVNYGGATGAEVFSLAQRIADSVKDRFGVLIEPEVNVW